MDACTTKTVNEYSETLSQLMTQCVELSDQLDNAAKALNLLTREELDVVVFGGSDDHDSNYLISSADRCDELHAEIESLIKLCDECINQADAYGTVRIIETRLETASESLAAAREYFNNFIDDTSKSIYDLHERMLEVEKQLTDCGVA